MHRCATVKKTHTHIHTQNWKQWSLYLILKVWFWQAKRVCSSVQFGSLWSHARSKSLRFTLVLYGVCWHNKFFE